MENLAVAEPKHNVTNKKLPKTVQKTDDPIISQIGDLGPYQIMFCAFVFCSKFGTGWHALAHIFLAARNTPTCIESTNPNATDQCDGCSKWEYDKSVFNSTIVTEWDLVCENKWLATFTGSLVMTGLMIGSVAFGLLADLCGRRPVFLACCMSQLVAGLLVCVSPNYWFYCVFRMLVGVATGGALITSFVLIVEIVGPKYREMIVTFYHMPFIVGHASLAVFGYFIREWRWFQFSITIFSVVFVFYFCIIPESPRWLLITGKVDKSIKILEKIAKFNNIRTDTIRGEIEAAAIEMDAMAPVKKGYIVDLFRTPILRLKTICMAIDWFVVLVVYFGMGQYIGSLNGNIYLNVGITAIMGVPGALLCMVLSKLYGRRKTMITSYFISSISLMTLTLWELFDDLPEIGDIVCAAFGMFGASIAFPHLYLYAGELFPTVVRSNGVGLCSMIGRFGSIVAPFVSDITLLNMWMTPLVLFIFTLIALSGTLLLPETKGHPLPEKLEDAESNRKR